MVTAIALLTQLPAGNSDRRYVSEWLAETLSAIYRIERRLAAEVAPCEPPESRWLRYDEGELVECDALLSVQRSTLNESASLPQRRQREICK